MTRRRRRREGRELNRLRRRLRWWMSCIRRLGRGVKTPGIDICGDRLEFSVDPWFPAAAAPHA